MSKQQRESNGPARQDGAIKQVRSNPAGYFSSAKGGGGSTAKPSASGKSSKSR